MLRDILLWYLWVQAFAFGGWLIASRWLAGLPDRGYGISKVVGLIVGGFAYWAGVTLGFSSNHSGAALLGLAIVWLAGLWLQYDPARVPLTYLVSSEFVFALAFVGWSLVRAYSPKIDIGEKFMETMMINAILRSPSFPPHDAWLAGYSLSYYYFGYMIFAMLILLSGVPSTIGFNLGGAMIFALAVIGGFSLGYNLYASLTQSARPTRAALTAGLLTATMFTLMGNLGGVLGLLKCANALPDAFWIWLDVRKTATRSYACDGLVPRQFDWWWDWSRVVKDTAPDGRYQETITEVPIFSFIWGDNHPHVMGLPLAMLVFSLAFATLRSVQVHLTPAQAVASFVLTAIIQGGVAFMNIWDWPIYSLIFVAASILGSKRPLFALARSAGILALGFALYLPWQVTFASQASGIAINLFNSTRLTHFGLLFAPFLIAGPGFLVWATHAIRLPARYVVGSTAGLAVLIIAAGLAGMVIIGLLSPHGRALLEEWQTMGSVQGYPSTLVTQRLIARAMGPWTLLVLASIAAWGIVVLISSLSRPTRSLSASDLLVLLLLVAGALPALVVEFAFVRDLFGRRMNTVFKFYYQTWTLWAIAGGYAIMRMMSVSGFFHRTIGLTALGAVVLGMVYPPMAIYARSNGFRESPTLDGAAYLQMQQPEDIALIAWLNANVQGTPRILESPTKKRFSSFVYESRIATFTGLPTILGWGGHQRQWRGRTDIQAERFPLIEQLYNTPDPEEGRALLRRFEVTYVVVGQIERARFSPDGLAKFEVFCRPVFRAGQSTLYQCPTA